MMERWACALALAVLLMLPAATALAQTVTMDYGEVGLRLHVDETLVSGYGLEAGMEQFGEVACLPITCMNPEFRDSTLAQMRAAYEAGDAETYNALSQEFYAHWNLLYAVFIMDSGDYQRMKEAGQAPFDGDAMMALGEQEGCSYWLASYDALPEKALAVQSEEEIAGWQACREALGSVEAFLEFIPITRRAAVEEGGVLPAFATKDLNGNDVTNTIFAEKDVTIINFWGTFCSPCIGEMPELGAWMRELPENVQLIGVVTDAMLGDDSTAEKAAQILDNADAPFVSLLLDDALAQYCAGLVGVPTTVLVNSEGRIIGEPILGAQVNKYRQALEQALGAQ